METFFVVLSSVLCVLSFHCYKILFIGIFLFMHLSASFFSYYECSCFHSSFDLIYLFHICHISTYFSFSFCILSAVFMFLCTLLSILIFFMHLYNYQFSILIIHDFFFIYIYFFLLFLLIISFLEKWIRYFDRPRFLLNQSGEYLTIFSICIGIILTVIFTRTVPLLPYLQINVPNV